VGAAPAHCHRAGGAVPTVVFGDGAMNQGAVHEALNFAAAFSLPVVFVCKSNRYSELTPIAAMVGDPHLHKRAAGYGMAGNEVDATIRPPFGRQPSRHSLARGAGTDRPGSRHARRESWGTTSGTRSSIASRANSNATTRPSHWPSAARRRWPRGFRSASWDTVEREIERAIDEAASWALGRPLARDASV
jgi:pyruvate dehydrogenase E1 component alpha subunit